MRVHIRRRPALALRFRQVAQKKIFLPAHDGAVRAPEHHKRRAVRQPERGHRQLNVRRRVHHVVEPGNRRTSKPRAVHHAVHEEGRHFGVAVVRHDLFPGVALPEAIPHLRQGHLFLVRTHTPGKIRVNQLGQHQPVHLVEGRNGKRHVVAPGQVIKDICHKCTSNYEAGGFFSPLNPRTRAAWP